MAGPPLRIVLDEVRFRRLVAGQVVAVSTPESRRIEMILSDIGWTKILRAILDGMAAGVPGDRPIGPPDPPQAREFLPLRRKGWGRRWR